VRLERAVQLEGAEVPGIGLEGGEHRVGTDDGRGQLGEGDDLDVDAGVGAGGRCQLVGARRRAVGEHHPAGAPAPVERDEASKTPAPMAPAPTTTTLRPARPPSSRCSASSTAAWLNDVVPRAMAVSERTRLPVWTA